MKALDKDAVLRQYEYELCRKDPWHWLTHWVFTIDEHDRVRPLKQFPDKEYLKHITEIWLSNDKVLIAKSRQMMMTWLSVALYLHDTQFHQGRLNFFVSKKEDNADTLVGRAHYIYEQQPKFLKPYEVKRSFCKLEFPEIYSSIKGVPQGGDQLRMFTASGIFSDEMAFQTEAESSYLAAKPTIEGGGRFTGVSTAFPSFFEELFKDNVGVYSDEEWEKKKGTSQEEMPAKANKRAKRSFQQVADGLKVRENRNGFMAVRLHYSADPIKRTEEWFKKTRPGYSEAGWRREMEIDFEALGGQLAFRKYFTDWGHKIEIEPPKSVPNHWPKFGTMDYGTQSPTAFLVYTINKENEIIFIWEYHSPGPLYKHAQAILDCPYYDQLGWITIDPKCEDKTQNVEGNLCSISELLQDQYGITTIPGNNNREVGRDRLEWHWRDLENRSPSLMISKDCKNLLKELKNIRYQEWSAMLAQKRNKKEDTVKKDDHCYDSLRYGILSQPTLEPNPMAMKHVSGKVARRISHVNQIAQSTFGKGDDQLGQFYG